jgi:hypothetical protein
VPIGGLDSTSAGKITLKLMPGAVPVGGDETRLPLPRSSTCSHEVHLPNYQSRDALADKLLLALDHLDDGFEEAALDE